MKTEYTANTEYSTAIYEYCKYLQTEKGISESLMFKIYVDMKDIFKRCSNKQEQRTQLTHGLSNPEYHDFYIND